MKYTVAELMFIAVKAWYESQMICILLSDKKEIRFPVGLNTKQKLATDAQRDSIEIICNGTGLHRPEPDEDLSLIGIVEGRFGY
ncbi:MAG: DUF2442 domain-containing protein [Bacteroidota bacterium]